MSGDDLPQLLQLYLLRMRDYVKKLKGGYLDDELREEKSAINELGKKLQERNRDSSLAPPEGAP